MNVPGNARAHLENRRLKEAKKYDPTSTTITNDVPWYDEKGKKIRSDRCGTISAKMINGYWYMVGSENHYNYVSVRILIPFTVVSFV